MVQVCVAGLAWLVRIWDSMAEEETASEPLLGHYHEKKDPTPLLECSVKGARPDRELLRTYWWRWVVLLVFSVNLASNNAQWLTFSPIADVVRCYYGVSNFWVNSLSMVNMLVYILLFLLSALSLERLGLRTTIVIASCLNALGAALRVAGTGRHYFWLLLSGQTVGSATNALMWGAPSLLSSVWFPPSERATATALTGTIFPQFGNVVVFGLSPLLVHSELTPQVCSNDTNPKSSPLYEQWYDDIYSGLFYYLLGQAVFCVGLVALTFVAFPNAPPTPPSISRKLLEESSSVQLKTLRSSLFGFLKNGYFLVYLVTAAINMGASGAIVSLVNEIVIPYFPDRDRDIAYLGIAGQVSGILLMIVIGRLLDWTKAFYAINVSVYVVAALSLAWFSAAVQFQRHFIMLYFSYSLLISSIVSFQAISYEYAVEMTYPLPEGTSANMVNVVSQVVSIAMTVVVGQMSPNHVPIGTWFITGVTAFGALLTVFIKPELRRVKIDNDRRESQGIVSNGSIQEDITHTKHGSVS